MQQQTTKKREREEEKKNTVRLRLPFLLRWLCCLLLLLLLSLLLCICCSIFVRLRHANSLPGDLWVREHDNEQAGRPEWTGSLLYLFFLNKQGIAFLLGSPGITSPYETGRTVPIAQPTTTRFFPCVGSWFACPALSFHLAVELRLSTHSYRCL